MPKQLQTQRRLQPILTSERLKAWGFWLLMLLGIIIIVTFFQWWVKRDRTVDATGNVSRSSTIGKSLPVESR